MRLMGHRVGQVMVARSVARDGPDGPRPYFCNRHLCLAEAGFDLVRFRAPGEPVDARAGDDADVYHSTPPMVGGLLSAMVCRSRVLAGRATSCSTRALPRTARRLKYLDSKRLPASRATDAINIGGSSSGMPPVRSVSTEAPRSTHDRVAGIKPSMVARTKGLKSMRRMPAS